MRRALAAAFGALLCAGCGELGVTIDVSAKPDVPKLDYLRVEAVQGTTLVEQTFKLGDKALPQSVAIVSRGLTRGGVDITVQGLSAGRVEAVARVSGELKPASQALHVPVELERLCLPGAPMCGCTPAECGTGGGAKQCGLFDDGCGGRRDCGGCAGDQVCESGACRASACRPKTCAELGATCGLTLDGCGRTIDCGRCDAGLNCGGGGTANTCGPGICMPRTACDAGMQCGSLSDGCGGLISCGTCPQGGVCGSEGVPYRCPCVPATVCPAGKQCGQWPNGCNTGVLDCGMCTLPQTCMGGGQPNQCGCTPLTCAPLQCGAQPNGCGGMLNCGMNCPIDRACTSPDGGAPRCTCTGGLTECNGACVDLQSSAQNCGACGRTCPGGQGCYAGQCPCVDAGSNADGHCCPAGWFLSGYLENPGFMRCFKGPFDAGTQAEGLVQCAIETDAGYGRAVAALGSASAFSTSQTAAPYGACGSFLHGANNAVIDAENGNLTMSAGCQSFCLAASCACTTCSCAGNARACAQRFYCVMDPLAPRVPGPCMQSGECPPGMSCQTGRCVDAGVPFCVVDGDCPSSSGEENCEQRGANASTGLCR